jgi:spore coat polysaccharide biosynthesis protein SpsF
LAEFVLGTVQLGLAYGAANRTGKPSRETALALLRRAAQRGVRTLDTARAYGDAEARVGEALTELPERSLSAVTKLSPLADIAERATPGEVVAAVESSVQQSLSALRTNRLDCLLLHRAAHLSQFGGAVWQRLLDYQTAGIITTLGVSVQSPAEVAAALAVPAVRHIQMPFNLLDWRWNAVVECLATRSDVVVHVRSVFLQGLLAAGDASIWPAIDGVDAAAVLAAIGGLVRDLHRDSAADLCLAYARGQDFIDGVVIGLETEAQLDDNLALFARPALTSDEIAAVQARLPQLPEQLLNPALWPKK